MRLQHLFSYSIFHRNATLFFQQSKVVGKLLQERKLLQQCQLLHLCNHLQKHCKRQTLGWLQLILQWQLSRIKEFWRIGCVFLRSSCHNSFACTHSSKVTVIDSVSLHAVGLVTPLHVLRLVDYIATEYVFLLIEYLFVSSRKVCQGCIFSYGHVYKLGITCKFISASQN